MQLRAGTLAAALILCASAAGAQQVSASTTTTTNQCVPRRAVIDTTTSAARVNVGGGSTAQNEPTVNNATSKSTQVSANEHATVDSSRVANIPARNSDRRAVKVNVGGGSVPITKTNGSGTGASANGSVALPTCPDSMSHR
ncbi:MAG TPA: hypothetical protein VJ867_03945 [Gemmatimonadaceae bacterium]|nr:hypothetical protein [Gemmatimonadaceae bacterium]